MVTAMVMTRATEIQRMTNQSARVAAVVMAPRKTLMIHFPE